MREGSGDQRAAYIKKKYGDYRGPGQEPHQSMYQLRFARGMATHTNGVMKAEVVCFKCSHVNTVVLQRTTAHLSLAEGVYIRDHHEFACSQCSQPLRVTLHLQAFRYWAGE